MSSTWSRVAWSVTLGTVSTVSGLTLPTPGPGGLSTSDKTEIKKISETLSVTHPTFVVEKKVD